VATTLAPIAVAVATIQAAIAVAVATIQAAIAAAVATTLATITAALVIILVATAVVLITAIAAATTQVALGTVRLGAVGTRAIIIRGPSSRVGSGLASQQQERTPIEIQFKHMDAIVILGSSYASEWQMLRFTTRRSDSRTAGDKI
jgi:hypothetical protein